MVPDRDVLSDQGGCPYCGADCAVCDRLRAENERYQNALIEIGEWDETRTLGYERPREIARRALERRP